MRTTPLEGWIAAKIGREGLSLDREALRSYQLAKLNGTLALAQQASPLYRRALGGKRIVLSSLAELADLPLTTPEQLAAAPLDFLCVPQDEVERIVTLPTSGTTGPPKRVFFTADDQELTRDFFHWGMSTMVEPGDKVLILLPGSLPGSVGDLLKDGLARMDVEGVAHGPVTDPRHTLEVIERERITALVGIPVQVLALARLFAAEGRSGASELRTVLLSTDRVPDSVVRAIESAWGCDVFNHYGMTEMGLDGGVDCRARAGYHLREADLLFEVIDPVTGRPAPEGAEGEVVFTTLTRAAMPLIRYRTGDVSRFIAEPCPCGTVLQRLAHVDARLAGGIGLAGGGVLSQKDLDDALFPLDGLTDFRLVLYAGQEPANITLQVKRCTAGPGPSEAEIGEALLGIPSLFQELAQGGISLEVQEWDAVEGNNSGTGKRKIVQLQGAMR